MSARYPPRYDLGDCTVTLVSGGRLKLDGGAMFGLIPKALWSRTYPADDQNRIQLACNCLLVEWPGRSQRVIIETGHGPKYTDKEQQIFAIDPAAWLLPALRSHGVDPLTITDVVVSHLVPTFPQARVHVQRAEFEDARAKVGIMTATYRDENFTPVDQANAWRVLAGAVEIVPGIRAMPTPGHTRGHHSIVVTGRDRALVFGGDLLPTRHHVGAPYNMAYDLFPLENRASKQKLLEWLAAHDALLAIDHELETPILSVRPTRDWFELIPEPPAGS
jgi:glyoxylase-like metal-dependent hydrolase (beta-lactamase superfamily II)